MISYLGQARLAGSPRGHGPTSLLLVHGKEWRGKTTSAVLLCAAAHARGLAVTLIYSDAQGTATAWAYAAEEAGDTFPWPIITAATPAHLARTLDGHNGLVIVDTPPGGYDVIETAIEAGDLILSPTSASPLDINRVWPTVEATSHKPAVVYLSQIDSRPPCPRLPALHLKTKASLSRKRRSLAGKR